jgi:hypothetical protein
MVQVTWKGITKTLRPGIDVGKGHEESMSLFFLSGMAPLSLQTKRMEKRCGIVRYHGYLLPLQKAKSGTR